MDQELISELEAAVGQVKAANDKKEAIKEMILNRHPFKAGEIVIIKIGELIQKKVFIKAVEVDDEGAFLYTFKKVDYNGQASNRSFTPLDKFTLCKV